MKIALSPLLQTASGILNRKRSGIPNLYRVIQGRQFLARSNSNPSRNTPGNQNSFAAVTAVRAAWMEQRSIFGDEWATNAALWNAFYSPESERSQNAYSFFMKCGYHHFLSLGSILATLDNSPFVNPSSSIGPLYYTANTFKFYALFPSWFYGAKVRIRIAGPYTSSSHPIRDPGFRLPNQNPALNYPTIPSPSGSIEILTDYVDVAPGYWYFFELIFFNPRMVPTPPVVYGPLQFPSHP